jgi:hypothetical protein
VTATREKLLDMAENFEAMGWTSEAADARLAASKLAPPAPDDARQIAVGDRVRVVAIENGAPDSRVGMVGLIDEITDYDASHRVKFEDGEVWYFQPSELAAVRASSGAPRIDAPDDAPRFKVGDDVIVSLDENDRERGKVAATCANGYGVDFADGHRTWCAPSQLTLAPPADAPDDEGLSTRDALDLECFAGDLAADDEWDRFADLVLGVAKKLRTALANGAGEVERLRAELADARRYLAETERALEKKRGAFNFECSLRSTAERARLDAEKERDALRAELDAVRRERADPNAAETITCHAVTVVTGLRAELDEARRERDEALSKLGEVGVKLDFARADLDDARCALGQRDGKIAALESKLAAAKAGPVPHMATIEWAVNWLQDNRLFSEEGAQERLREINIFLRCEDIGSVHNDAADQLARAALRLIQARGETEAGK